MRVNTEKLKLYSRRGLEASAIVLGFVAHDILGIIALAASALWELKEPISRKLEGSVIKRYHIT